MKRCLVVLLSLLMLAGCAENPKSLVTPVRDGVSPPGPIVLGKWAGGNDQVWIPFVNDGTGEKAVIATQKYVDSKQPVLPSQINSPFSIVTGATGSKLWLSMYTDGSGHSNAPTSQGAESQYLKIGGREYGTGTYQGIGFGYAASTSDVSPGFIGFTTTNSAGNTDGNLIFATRNSTSNVALTTRLSIGGDGNITAANGYTPTVDTSLTTKAYVDKKVGDAVNQAYAQGKSDGYTAGKSDGYTSGYNDGYVQGEAYGLASCNKNCSTEK